MSTAEFDWDRDLPVLDHFFAIGSRAVTDFEPGTVMVQVRDDEWSVRNLGLVTKQTPLGQGQAYPVRSFDLRLATPEQIERAIQTDHPHGADFRPSQPRFMRRSTYSRMLRNWESMAAKQRQAILDQLALRKSA